MSIITDIGKTVRNRIVGERVDAPKGAAKPEHGSATAASAEPTKSRLRHSVPRKAGSDNSDNGEQVGSAQQIGEISSRQVSEAPVVPEATTKSDTVLHLLRRPDGATMIDLMAATSWQRHSIRGFLSGTVRKKLGLNLVSDITDGGDRRYRIPSDADADGSAPIDTVPNGPPSIPNGIDAPTDTVVC